MAPFFITVFYNGLVENTNTEGVVFRCHNTSLLKLRSKFTLAQLRQAIETKISPDHSKKVSSLIYRYPITLTTGHKFYGDLHLTSDEDVDLMCEQFKTCKHLGLSTPEVYADLVENPSNYTQPQPTHVITSSSPFAIPYSQQTETPYADCTPSTYHQLNPSSSQSHIPYQEPSHTLPHQSIPSSSQNPFDLNTTYNMDGQTDTPPVSILHGVHNEEVGDFSENEDDMLQREDAEEPIVATPHNTVALHEPVPHFVNIIADNTELHDVEYGHSMDRNRELAHEDPNQLKKGMKFATKELAQNFIQTYHLQKSLEFRVPSSSTTRWILCCVHEHCLWRCVVRLGKKSGVWEITQLDEPHTCTTGTLSQDHRQLTATFMSESMLQLVKSDPTISVAVLIAHIRERYTYQSSYRKAWIAKQKAIERIYGNWEESYNQVTRWLCAFSHYIPNSVYDWEYKPFYENGQEVGGKGVFHRIFWSYGPCIKGFNFCKPVVSIDGTWLYGRYKGCLLLAIAQDGRSNCFPIAYAVVEGETADAWYFFLSRLRAFVTPQEGLCLISDRHESIKSAIRRIDSSWKHVFCIRHIAQNFMRHFKNTSARKAVVNMAYSMTEKSANHYKVKIGDEVGPDGVGWVEDIDPEQWMQWCDGGYRWGHMTTNLAECINNVFKGLRNLPIHSLIAASYFRMNETFVKRGTQAQGMLESGTMFSEKLMAKIEHNRAVSNTHNVAIHDRAQKLFRVEEIIRPQSGRPASTFVVNFKDKICECGEFQALHYPCSHVIAACSKVNYDHMQFVHPQYTMRYVFNTYFEEFPPLPSELSWPDFISPELQHDPSKRRDKKGRPQSTRIRTEMDQREKGTRTKRCGICRNEGHNKNNCPNRNLH